MAFDCDTEDGIVLAQEDVELPLQFKSILEDLVDHGEQICSSMARAALL